MAYTLYLYKEFVSPSGKTIRLEIFEKDFAGASSEIEAMSSAPVFLTSDNMNNEVFLPIIKTSLAINIINTGQIDYTRFFTSDGTKFKVVVKVSGTPEWTGFLTPDSFQQNEVYKSVITLTARDNLGTLSEYDFDITTTFITIRTLINTAMTRISFPYTYEFLIDKLDSAGVNILDGVILCAQFLGKTWQEALNTTLRGIGGQLRYIGGNTYAIFDIGKLKGYGDALTAQTFLLINKSGVQEIIPAWKSFTMSQDYQLRDNVYDGLINETEYEFDENRGGSATTPYNNYVTPYYGISLSNDWLSDIPMFNPYLYKNIPDEEIYITGTASTSFNILTTKKLSYAKHFPALNDGHDIRIQFKANNYPFYIDRPRGGEYSVYPILEGGYLYTMAVRCNIFYETATTKYVLKQRKWVEYTDYNEYVVFELPQTERSFLEGPVGGPFLDRTAVPQNQDINISISGLSENGLLTIEFYPYTAEIEEAGSLPHTGAGLDYTLHCMKLSDFDISIGNINEEGLESSVVIDANYNLIGSAEVTIGQVPQGQGSRLSYLGGIFTNSNPYYPPMYDFHYTGGTNYHLSELISREIVHHYKTQKTKLSGSVIIDSTYSAFPHFGKVWTDGTLFYALNYGSLDFANEVMQVELVEVEDYETEDFTFVEAAIDAGGGSNLGSGDTTFLQWSAAGNATRIYSLDTATEAEQGGAYVVIDKIGLASARKVALLDLLVDAYTKTESDAKYLGITAKAADSELLDNHDSTYFATATGGSGYIQNQIASAQTADYWISGKAKMGTLVLPTSATLASGEVGLYTTESGFSGETPGGAGSMTNITLSLPTGLEVSLDNTNFAQSKQITGEGGTFYTRIATNYVLPTVTQLNNKIETSLIGVANGIAPLDSGGKIALGYLPSTLLKYVGVWNASTNTPTLTNPDTTKKGYVYNVSVAGTQFGIAFKLGDWLIYNDSGVPEKSDNSDDVTSVNSYTGAVTLKTSDITEQTNLYYTDARVKAYADTLYTPIAHGQITSGNPHGTTAADVGAVALSGTELTLNQDLNALTDLGTWFTLSTVIDASLINRPSSLTGECYVVNKGGVDYFEQEFSEIRGNTRWFRDYRGGTWGAWKLNYNSGNSNLSAVNWSAAKLTSTTLILPQSVPSLTSGEMAIYGLESGFSGETPSGAGSVTSITMVVPTGLSVSPETITESGTFTISYASGYQMMTTAESSKLAGIAANANNYSLPTATDSVLGGVKIGSNITITDGVISVAAPYTLPTATGSILGGVKIGTNVNITDGVISVHNPVTLGTANGLSLSTQVLSLGLASTSTNGALSSTDWNTFNGKAAGNHNHDLAYLGITAKAADSELLDGHDSTYFATATGGNGYIQNQIAAAQTADYWISGKAKMGTLVLPTSATLASGEVGLYTTESGFSGELPSGAGSMTNVTLNTLAASGLVVSNNGSTFGTSAQLTGEGGTLYLDFSGEYQLMTASESLKLAGIAANANNYSLPTATDSILGGVKIGSNITITDGVISVAAPYTLPTATGSVLGGVKIGTNVSITDGVISVHNPVTLGTANGLSLSTQVLSLGLASTNTNGALSSTDWNTFNGKQEKLIGTGTSSLVRVNTFGVIAYDDSTYLTGNQTITLSGIITGSGTTTITTAIADGALSIAKTNGLQSALDGKLSTTGKAADSDLLDGHDTAYFAKAAGDVAQAFSVLSLTAADVVKSGGNKGFQNDVYYTNVANPIWTFGNAPTYGMSYYQGFALSGIGEAIGFHFGIVGTPPFYVTRNGDIKCRDIVMGGALSGATTGSFSSTLSATVITMSENINTNLRIPKVAPTSPTSGEYYFYIVE